MSGLSEEIQSSVEYKQGWDAYENGESNISNPYAGPNPEKLTDPWWWFFGWCDAMAHAVKEWS